MRLAGFFLLGLLAVGPAAAADTAARDPVLIRAQVLRYLDGDDSVLTPRCEPPPGMECIQFTSYFKMRIKVTSVLVGDLPHRYFNAYIPMHAAKLVGEGYDMVFLLADLHSGRLDVRVWDRIPDGLCMLDEENIADLGHDAVSPKFAGELRAAVRRFPCKSR